MAKPSNRPPAGIFDHLITILIVVLIAAGAMGYYWFTKKVEQIAENTLKPAFQPAQDNNADNKQSLNYAFKKIVEEEANKSLPADQPRTRPETPPAMQPTFDLTPVSAEQLQEAIQKFRASPQPIAYLSELEKRDKNLMVHLLQNGISDASHESSRQIAVSYCLSRKDLAKHLLPALRQSIEELVRVSPSEQRNTTMLLVTHVYVSLKDNPAALKSELIDLLRDEHDTAVLRSINNQFGSTFPNVDRPFVISRDE